MTFWFCWWRNHGPLTVLPFDSDYKSAIPWDAFSWHGNIFDMDSLLALIYCHVIGLRIDQFETAWLWSIHDLTIRDTRTRVHPNHDLTGRWVTVSGRWPDVRGSLCFIVKLKLRLSHVLDDFHQIYACTVTLNFFTYCTYYNKNTLFD